MCRTAGFNLLVDQNNFVIRGALSNMHGTVPVAIFIPYPVIYYDDSPAWVINNAD
jgi:hypothetical protein